MAAYDLTLLQQYDLQPPIAVHLLDEQGMNNTTRLVSSGSGMFILKQYQTYSDVEMLRYEHQLTEWLAKQPLTFAVPSPVVARNGATLIRDGDGLLALFPHLPGRAPDRNRSAVVEAAGAGLAELHDALSRYPLRNRSGFAAGYDDLGAIHPRIPDPWSLTPADLGLPDKAPQRELLTWWRDDLTGLSRTIDQIYASLPHQVVHGDFSLGNTLFDDDRLTAILDFEFSLLDARAIDVAAGLRSVFTSDLDENGFQLAKAFCGGYHGTACLSKDECKALPILMHLREAVSTIWWLGRGMTESDAAEQIERIERMQSFVRWIDQHSDRLAALASM